MANQNFGGNFPTTRYADDALLGYGARGYNWDFTAEVQHELRPGVSMSGGYYRNWFGSFLSTDNILVTPADYDPFCITAPKDARLPGGGGYQVCGLADITPAKFGQVNSVITQSDNYGKMQRVNDFFNATINARLARGAQVGGGVDFGRSVNDACFNVDSPGAVATSLPGNLAAGGAGLLSIPTPFTATTINGQKICRIVTPFTGQMQFKAFFTYPFPRDIILSAIWQNISGPTITASYAATNAQIAPSARPQPGRLPRRGGLHRHRHGAAHRSADDVRWPADAPRPAAGQALHPVGSDEAAGQRQRLQRVQRQRELDAQHQLRPAVAAAVAPAGRPHAPVQRELDVLNDDEPEDTKSRRVKSSCKVIRTAPVHRHHSLLALWCCDTRIFRFRRSSAGPGQPPASSCYEGARLIPGDGRAPIADSAFLVERGTITNVGRKGDLKPPAGAGRVDLTGKTVMPALINAHGHPGFQRGLTYSADNFTRDTVMDDLNRALYFGVVAVQSQGIERGDVTYQIRAEQEAGRLGGARLHIAGRGIGAPNAGPGGAAYAGIAYEVTTEDQARKAVQELAARKVNLVKIWVDDRNGRAPRLPPNLFRAIIDEGHKHGLQVNAHVFYYTDAVDLVNAGIDSLVHLVRDKEMDDALVASVVRHNVYVQPNLSPEWNTYLELPHWLRDGDPLMALLQESAPPAVIARMKTAFGSREAGCGRTDARTIRHPRAQPREAGQGQREDHAGQRHRPRGSPVWHVRAPRTREHGQGRHDAHAGRSSRPRAARLNT